jgi:TIR domain
MGEHTFISYAREDAAFALALAERLQARGLTLWVDQWNIGPGADWDKAIDQGLQDCANFLIILSPDAVASNEVRGELRTALNNRKDVVPVLYRPCEIPRPLKNVQYLDISDSGVVTDTALDQLARALHESTAGNRFEPDQYSDAPPINVPRCPTQLSQRELRNRRDVLDDVKSETVNRLAQSLQIEAPVAILKEMQAHQVEHSWQSEVKVSHPQRSPISAAGIVELFDSPAIAGKLLILGLPGAGKTFVLVQLAHELVIRAERDPGQAIPVLLNLSSWSGDKPIADWLVDEVQLKYGIRKEYGDKWRDDCLIPLLDGLDELPATNQAPCVRAINLFLRDHRPSHLVVCCRVAEYENLQTRLQLNGAIRLLPFQDEQIREYLARAECQDLWNSISEDAESLELARSPLLLGMMATAHEEMARDARQPVTSGSERRDHLFDLYARHLLIREGASGRYSKSQTTEWLARLAAMLQGQGQSDFLIERMQPDWLQSRTQRWIYRVAVALFTAVVVYVAAVAVNGLTELIPAGAVAARIPAKFALLPSLYGDLMKVLIPLVAGFIVAARNTIVPIETVRWSSAKARLEATRWLVQAAVVGLRVGVYIGIASGALLGVLGTFGVLPGVSLWRATDSGWDKAGAVTGVASGVLAAATLARVCWNVSLTRSSRPTLTPLVAETMAIGLVFGLVAGLRTGSPIGVLSGLAIALIAGLGHDLNQSSHAAFARPLILGAAIGLAIGAITSQLGFSSRISPQSTAFWIQAWMFGGFAVGTTLALVVSVITRREAASRTIQHEGSAESPSSGMRGFVRRWVRWGITGVSVGVVPGLIVSALARFGYLPIKGVALLLLRLELTLLFVISVTVLSALAVSMGAAILAGFLGALFGVLSGLTGRDVERRALPNQGIRQSAANVPMFALIGTIVVGIPYGLINLSAGALITRTIPDPADWLRLGLGSGLVFGVIGGLLPGAACIQHFSLRFVLWCSGFVPWRYPRFLDHATERMFLQRVGGRYRFIHVLLRDHLARMSP